jgi:hypothetical protein
VKNAVFRRRRKTDTDDDNVIDGGKLFQTPAAVTAKALSPIVECTVAGTTSPAVDAERSRCRDSTSATP